MTWYQTADKEERAKLVEELSTLFDVALEETDDPTGERLAVRFIRVQHDLPDGSTLERGHGEETDIDPLHPHFQHSFDLLFATFQVVSATYDEPAKLTERPEYLSELRELVMTAFDESGEDPDLADWFVGLFLAITFERNNPAVIAFMPLATGELVAARSPVLARKFEAFLGAIE
ncbi:hypothetical protein [Fodinicurvata sp. EGI_FJ10296]|uniref:hypothetical protein n=1 Tax=Fodinicurvata sp. EGI_FJ10296 TaxID=3231908 RepID=UPI0034519B5A